MYLLNNPLTLKLQDCVWGKNVIKGNEGIHSLRHPHGNNITKACLYNAEPHPPPPPPPPLSYSKIVKLGFTGV